MRIIRNNVFETNSSSTHALAIFKNGDKIKYPKKLRLDFNEFGWDYKVYNDTYSKASYIVTLIYTFKPLEEGEIYDSNCRNYYLDKFCNFLDKNNIQYTLPVIKEDSWGYEYQGYVDHSDEAYPWLLKVIDDEELLSKFLFDDKSYISTGNDNERGYYVPEIGYEDDSYDYDQDISKFTSKVEELKSNGYELDFKGN